jgi:hypothetical protein
MVRRRIKKTAEVADRSGMSLGGKETLREKGRERFLSPLTLCLLTGLSMQMAAEGFLRSRPLRARD